MELHMILVQIIGFFGTAATCLSYQFKKNSHLFLMLFLSYILFCIHFLLLGAYTGLIMNAIGMIRAYLLRAEKPWTNRLPVVVFVTLLTAFGGIMTWDGWYSLVPTIAMTISTPILWSRRPKVIRQVGLFLVSPSWIVYGIFAGSIAGVVTECITIISILISLIRYKGFRLENENVG